MSDLVELPLGSHCISFHASREEASAHAASFLAGNLPGMAAMYWVTDADTADYYSDRLSTQAPDQVGCVAILRHEQVEPVEGKLRPVSEVKEFIRAHPEGVSACGETISAYWSPENIADHVEYESWFQEQPRSKSRFLCPYDLRKVPPEMAPKVLRELGAQHSHAALSRSPDPAVRLMQLFAFGTPAEIPPQLRDTYRWATDQNLITATDPIEEMTLTSKGAQIVADWSRTATIDW
ncbi:MAG: MEDS domain-containing protein [Thermoplasmata archaeon]